MKILLVLSIIYQFFTYISIISLLFDLEFYCLHLIEPNVAICHQINTNLISVKIIWNIDLKFKFNFFLDWHFFHSKQIIVFIADNYPPCYIFYLCVFLTFHSIGSIVFFLYFYMNHRFSTLLNCNSFFDIFFRIISSAPNSDFYDWMTSKTFNNLLFDMVVPSW